MKRLGKIGLLLLLAWTLSTCGSDSKRSDEDDVLCTLEVRISVLVSVLDESGAPLAGAQVTYTVDGGALQDAELFPLSEHEFVVHHRSK